MQAPLKTAMAVVLVALIAASQARADAKADCEKLMGEALPFAQKMLGQYGEFYPYGYVMKQNGDIAVVAGQDETEHPQSQTIITRLLAAFKQGAAQKKLKATALVYDIRVVPPGSSVKSDAIAVALDHRDSYSVVIIYPYTLNNGELTVAAPFAQKGSSQVFDSK
jgi:hypothetical protein